jgi:hypothetical protein
MEHMSGVNLGDRDVDFKGDISRPPSGYSMLEQYARDWGFGKNLGSVYKKKHHHDCEWAVPHALKEWDDHFSMGKPPVQPLSPEEMALADGPDPVRSSARVAVAQAIASRVVPQRRHSLPAPEISVAEALAKAGRPSLSGNPASPPPASRPTAVPRTPNPSRPSIPAGASPNAKVNDEVVGSWTDEFGIRREVVKNKVSGRQYYFRGTTRVSLSPGVSIDPPSP